MRVYISYLQTEKLRITYKVAHTSSLTVSGDPRLLDTFKVMCCVRVRSGIEYN